MNIEKFRDYCLSKPGVTENYPFKGEAVWLKVLGKMFAMANVTELKMDGEMVPPFHFINLKCEPERAIELREQHSGIRPGWHTSKVHWNSLYINEGLSDELIIELIDHSYDIVVQKLTAKERKELAGVIG